MAQPLTIVIIGDSTVADYPADKPSRGWGQFIAGYFGDGVRVANHAISGRSTKSFRGTAWEKARAEKPNVVLIQFGHNDSHAKTEPKATDAATDYRDYLRQYIDETRALGALPVLITPMHRRVWKPDGTLDDILQPYADAMKAVAVEKEVPVIDLHAMSRELYLKLGEQGSLELANAPGDRTHFGEKGAKAMAELVMSKLPGALPKLKPLLKP
ncbi:MAG: rhamnogalacturonan acetylesterase [Chthoniobacteraceae bacterium]